MARKTISAEWANSAAPSEIVAPSGTKQNNGWTAEKPPYQNFNWAWQIFTNMLQNSEQNGIMEWSTDTTYPQYGLTLGSDGKVYQSQLASNQGNDPTTDGGTNWLEWIANGVEYSAGTSGYLKLPTWLGGFIIQWGQKAAVAQDSDTSVTFPTPFTSAVYVVIPNVLWNNTDRAGEMPHVRTQSTTGATIYNPKNYTVTITYFAIGK